MDRERLTELLNDPARASGQDVAALRSMAARFPWFSGAQLLLAVGERKAGDVLTGDPDSNPAAFLPSRAVLYDLVHPEEETLAPSQRKESRAVDLGSPPDEPVVIVSAQPPTATPEGHAPQEAPPGTALMDATAPDTVDVPVGNPVPEAVESDPGKPVSEPATTHERTSDLDILDRQIKEAIQAGGYHLEHSLAAIPRAEETPLPPAAEAPETTVPPAQGIPTDVAPQELATPPPAVIISKETRLSFTSWLDLPNAPARPPAAMEAGSEPSAPEPPSPDRPTPALSTSAIVEQFIQRSAPASTRPKATFFNPQQAAKKSLEDHGMVSETLARILEKQGNFTKAKEVYDRLALKHPEKSVYFAALSKAVEARMNK
jgi:hypothetical protein